MASCSHVLLCIWLDIEPYVDCWSEHGVNEQVDGCMTMHAYVKSFRLKVALHPSHFDYVIQLWLNSLAPHGQCSQIFVCVFQ